MASDLHRFRYPGVFVTEKGARLENPVLAYSTYGTPDADFSNVVWVCHALTADSRVCDWWNGLFGSGYLFDPARYFIVCVNNPGSCYGSTGPAEIDPQTGKPYGHTFPELTTRDIARLFRALYEALGIRELDWLVGGSQGGQIAQECILAGGFLTRHLLLLATNARHSAWGIAFNESQRLCIEADPTWGTDAPDAGREGMKVARSLALLSYRSYGTYVHFQTDTEDTPETYRAATYQRYQGEKLAKRFRADAYHALSKTMDSHHTGRGRGSAEAALGTVSARTLVIGISSDLLFPEAEQQFLAEHIPGARRVTIDSIYGHDGFLTETEKISEAVRQFRDGFADGLETHHNTHHINDTTRH